MKKIISLILVFIVIVAAPLGAYASESIALVKELAIMQGDADGSFRDNDTLTREEFVKVTIKTVEPEFVSTNSVSPYSDVSYLSWSAGYIQRASELGYFSGYPDGSFRPYEEVLPEQMCKIMLKLLGYETENTTANWAQAQITLANNKGLLADVNCQVGKPLLRKDAAKIIKNTLLSQKNNSNKYYIEEMGYQYHHDVTIISDRNVLSGYVSTSVGVFKMGNISSQDVHRQGDIIVNSDNQIICFLPSEQNTDEYIVKTVLPEGVVVFDKNGDKLIAFDDDTTVYEGNITSSYMTLSSTLKLGDKMRIFYDNMLNINYFTVTRDAILGPVTNMNGSFKTEFNITNEFTVNKDGMLSSADAIKDYDICYYIQEADTVLVYSKKITGIYEKAFPNKDNVQKIILSGKEYEVSTINAFNKLSANGNIMYGDNIRLLLDKDNKIADVMKMSENESIVGFLIDTGLKPRIDENDEQNIEYYAKVLLTDGTMGEYYTSKDYENMEGNTIAVRFRSGKAELAVLPSKNNISGNFNWDRRIFDSFKLSENVNIIDVANEIQYTMGKGKKIYPQRLHNAEIKAKDIHYIQMDNDIITDIILNNYTNDLYDYGIVLKDERISKQMAMQGTYELNINGINLKVVTPNTLFPVYTGQPAMFDFDNNTPVSMIRLNVLEEQVSKIDDLYVYTKEGKYLLSSDILIYQEVVNTSYDGRRYEIIPISNIDYTKDVSAYYDKSEKAAGRIRVIVIK